MKIKVFTDEIGHIRTIPFEVEVKGRVFKGVLSEFYTPIGGMPDLSYELEWNDEAPSLNDDEVIEAICEVLKNE